MTTEFILQSAANFPVALWMVSPLSAYQGCISDSFKIYLYSEDNNEHRIDLYSQGSNSIPWQDPQNKWSHLNPQWRFTDLSGNIINYITLKNGVITVFDSTTGYLASAEFYYIDDMPTTIGQDVSVWAVADFSEYPVYIDILTNSQGVSGFSNSLVQSIAPYSVFSLSPSYLEITRDGINPMFDFYWSNTTIPYIVSVIGVSETGSCTAVMKNFPVTNIQGSALGPVVRSINGIASTDLTWDPNNTISFLSALDYQGFCVGGYLKGTVSSNITANDISIYAIVSSLSGMSNPFDIYDFNGYDIRRFNESWNATDEIKKYARSSHIADNPVYWDNYMRSLWGDSNTNQGESFGREAYEKISNFAPNHIDINVCNINQLYDLATLMNVPMDIYGVELPAELRRIMDIASVNQQLLWGSRCNCNKNITNERVSYLSGSAMVDAQYLCKACGHYHAGNKGEAFNPRTYMVTAFTPFIIEDKTNKTTSYQLIIPPLSGSNIFTEKKNEDKCLLNSMSSTYLSTYPLSSYYHVMLPTMFDFGTSANENDFLQIISYFCFYDYVSTNPCTKQIAGIINWEDPFTTLDENLSSINDWYGNGQTLEKILNYTLHKGLGLIEG